MKINKNVYTQELDKAYTILKQQYIIIRCLLELVDSNNNYDDELTSIKQTIQRFEQLIQSIEGDLNAIEYDIDLINNYINTINEYIAQNGNTTEIGGNLEVDGNGQVNGNLNINGNLTIDGKPLSVGSNNVVREDTLGEFLNTVFSYQSKEDIPNQLQTQANVQNLKQISRDTTAIIARYDSLDYVLQIDALVGDTSVRGFIHGYLYNPNIKDIILVSINTANGVATLKFNTDSGSSGSSVPTINTSSVIELEWDAGNGRYKLPNNISSGMYVLTIVLPNYISFTTTGIIGLLVSPNKYVFTLTGGEMDNKFISVSLSVNSNLNKWFIDASLLIVSAQGNLLVSLAYAVQELFAGQPPRISLYKLYDINYNS